MRTASFASWCTTTRWRSGGSRCAGRIGRLKRRRWRRRKRKRGCKSGFRLAFAWRRASAKRGQSMNFLAIETSCDETSVAIFTEDLSILANVVASQVDLHARFGGVVPEVAARAHLQRLLPTLDEALRQANLQLADIGAIVVMNSPGLVGALLVG